MPKWGFFKITTLLIQLILLVLLLCMRGSTAITVKFFCQDGRQELYNFYGNTSIECRTNRNTQWLQTDGFAGSWWGHTVSKNDATLKFSGPTTTGTQKHSPIAVRKGDKTWFVVSGTSAQYPGVQHSDPAEVMYGNMAIMVGEYDHKRQTVSRPVTVHVKGTGDAHDNAVLNIDGKGYVYVFVSGRGSIRSGLIYKSRQPINAADDKNNAGIHSGFELLYHGNDLAGDICQGTCDHRKNRYLGFTYPQVWWMAKQQKFLMVNIRYLGIFNSKGTTKYFENDPNFMRTVYTNWIDPYDPNGLVVDKPRKLLAVKSPFTKGHYAISKERDGTIGLAFNLHIKDASRYAPWDNRSNIYFIYSKDGDNWYNINKQQVLKAGQTLTQVEDLAPLAVKEYHNPLTGQTNEKNGCFDGSHISPNINLGKVCRRIYLKDIDIATDQHGDVTRAEILFVGNKNTTVGPIPSADLDNTRIYAGRQSFQQGRWQEERVTNRLSQGDEGVLLPNWPRIDHNYASGTLSIVGDAVYFAVPSGEKPDGMAGGSRTAIIHSPTGKVGDLSDHINYKDLYPEGGDVGYVDNHIRSVHGSQGLDGLQLLWSHGHGATFNPDGSATEVYFGDWLNGKAPLPRADMPVEGSIIHIKAAQGAKQ